MTNPTDEILGAWLRRRRQHTAGWRRWIFPGLWLIYLAQVGASVHRHSSGAGAAVGYAVIVAFATCYLACLPVGWTNNRNRFLVLYGASLALTALEIPFAQRDAFVFFVYLGVLTVAGLPRVAPYIVAGMVAVTAFTPAFVPSWGGRPDVGNAIAVLLVPFAMYGFFSIMQSNVALAAARAEVARLAAENERSRIARDLHDLLGHSLTTVTVKAGLARRLAERGELERAAAEVTEVETSQST